MDTAPISTGEVPPVRTWRRELLALALLLGIIVAGFLLYPHFAISAMWRAAVEETTQLDPRWQFAELEADREVLPPAENSALFIMSLKGTVPICLDWNQLFPQELPANARFNEHQAHLIREELAKIEKGLERARQLKDMPKGRYQIAIADDVLSTDIDPIWSSRECMHALQFDAFLHAHELRLDEAMQSCRAILCTGRALRNDPIPWVYNTRMYAHHYAIDSLERALGQGTASLKELKSIQDALARDLEENMLLVALRGDRAAYHQFFENIRSGTTPMPAIDWNGPCSSCIAPPKVASWTDRNFPSFVLRHYPDFLRHMNRVVELAKLPIHERSPEIEAWEKECDKHENPIIRIYAPSAKHSTHCNHQARLRCAVVALACERYRMLHERWPNGLEVLVKEKLLLSIPLDPYDGKQLRYRQMKERIVIYAVGTDLIDDLGNVDLSRGMVNGTDVGFQLWDVPARYQDPPPIIAVPETKDR